MATKPKPRTTPASKPKRKGPARPGIGAKKAAATDRHAPTEGGPKRTEAERTRDLAEITRLYLRGLSQQGIADALNAGRAYSITRQTVSKDLAEVRGLWLEDAAENYDQHVARELARIDNLEATYWQGWERSQRDETVKGGKTITSPPSKPGAAAVITRQEGTVKTKTLVGDPSFLRGVENCIRMRMDLLGLAAPDVHLLGGLQGDTGRRVNFTLNLGDRTIADEGAD